MDNPIDAQNLEETAKKFDEKMKDLQDQADKAYKELKNAQELINYNDTLIEKIINNSIMITKSPQMVEVIKKLKTKLDEETLSCILNLVVYTSSAAAHQAIMFYDEILRQKLITDFVNIEKAVQEHSIKSDIALDSTKILNVRLNEVREKLQLDSLNP